ncbi:hypothetical protein L598_003100000290 [Mesorhizobium sp. J18]|uniref:hypothetical protein n=1 Tax=Mesorhizobium sp. J18 TaxID=935263 RepID=UPI00119B2220
MRKFLMALMAATLAAMLQSQAVMAQDDDDDDDDGGQVTLASKDLPELILGSAEDDFAVNQTSFELEAGQAYRWKITSQGNLEYKFFTDLFRNVWMNQIVINDLEVHMNGAPAWLEFDAHGTIQVQFVAARPGFHTWSVRDLEKNGMQGTIIVK